MAQHRRQGLGGESSYELCGRWDIIDARQQIEAAPDEHTEMR